MEEMFIIEEVIPEVDLKPVFIVGHLPLDPDVFPEGHFFTRIHFSVFLGRISQRHVRRRDVIEKEERLIPVLPDVAPDLFHLIFRRNPFYNKSFTTVLKVSLSRVPMVVMRAKGIIEPDDTGTRMNMPFPNQCRLIAGGLEHLWQYRIGQPNPFTTGRRAGHISKYSRTASAILAAQKTRPRRGTDRVICTRHFETYPLLGKAVDVGRPDNFVPVTADFKGPELITQADDRSWVSGLIPQANVPY